MKGGMEGTYVRKENKEGLEMQMRVLDLFDFENA